MNITLPSMLLINGQIGSGKSHFIRYLFSIYKNKLKYGIVFSHTCFNEGNFDYIPEKYIYSEYNGEVLHNLMKIQEQQPKNQRHLAFVVFDDCLFDSYNKCKYFNRLSVELRHYNILLIISTQYAHKLPPTLREQAYQVIIFNAFSKRNINALFESYGQNFNCYNDFKEYILGNTGEYKFIYHDRKEKDKDKQYQIMRCPKNFKKFKLAY